MIVSHPGAVVITVVYLHSTLITTLNQGEVFGPVGVELVFSELSNVPVKEETAVVQSLESVAIVDAGRLNPV